MRARRRKPREKDLTDRLLDDGDDETDRLESHQRFTDRSKHAEQDKIERTSLLRAAETEEPGDVESLPIGEVVQVYSLFCQVEHPTGPRICVTRKTLSRLSETSIVVGDRVRFRDRGSRDESGRMEAVLEQVLPRQTVLTRAGSFHNENQQPIVANAKLLLIVASLAQPRPKWGLIDRMLVAAQSGGLTPMLCLNKIDLSAQTSKLGDDYAEAVLVLKHYHSLGIATFETSPSDNIGIEPVKKALAGQTTVLAGHSGVGKSTLISAIQPGLDIRVGAVSAFNEKGRHTTSSARRYVLDIGGYVIDTPGVKMFGLWKVTRDKLVEFFPDVEAGTAPPWRVESFTRIKESL
jgi:ribosome biogenesis GTPase / thiamine phosphate phosphatase